MLDCERARIKFFSFRHFYLVAVILYGHITQSNDNGSMQSRNYLTSIKSIASRHDSTKYTRIARAASVFSRRGYSPRFCL